MYIFFLVFLIGLSFGSFINCLVYRLHEKKSLMNRSFCPKCKKQIAWYDNIPLMSFIALGGKCRHCKQSISWQYPLIELVTGVLFLIALYVNYKSRIVNQDFIMDFSIIHNSLFFIQLIRDWFIIVVMIIIFIYDLKWYLILDVITLPACVIVFVLNLILGISWQNMLISGIIGLGFFLAQFLISKGKWIGGGDLRLGLLMGFALAWPNILLALFLAYIIGSIVSVFLLILGKKKWGSQVPLGIFLSTAALITLFWGNEIINWYMNLVLF